MASSLMPIPSSVDVDGSPEARRAGNYGENIWDFNYLQSLELSRTFKEEEEDVREVESLSEEVKSVLKASMNALLRLEMVDTLERLGLKHRFQEEIKETLIHLSKEVGDKWWSGDLHATALRFRLFRQHGIFTSEDDFKIFQRDDGRFEQLQGDGVKGVLSMYEACFVGLEGDVVLDEVKAFATSRLLSLRDEHALDSRWMRKVEHALDLPLHWRLPRVEAMWFIGMYEDEEGMNPLLHKLAVLDFNLLQSRHRQEIGKLARWWVEKGFDKLHFGRNCLVESYMFCYGMAFEQEYSRVREVGTQLVALVTTIDDIYDTYGSMDELNLFTDFANRWDISQIDLLPKNIRMCFLAMYNNCNEIGYRTMKEKGYNVIPYLSKAWADLLKSYLREAKWYHQGFKPTFEDYMENALISIGVHPVILSNYYLTSHEVTKEALDYVDSLPSLLRNTNIIFRLLNDMGTSSYELARGDTLKAVQCYMHQHQVAESVARENITILIHNLWKKVNGAMFEDAPLFNEAFVEANINSIRAAQFFYKNGDGYGADPENLSKKEVLSLLFNPL